MGVHIYVFGEFSVEHDGGRIPIKSVPAAKLLALLITAPDCQLSRQTITELLWPGTPFSSAGNRLRTSLVELKRALAPLDLVDASRNHVSLKRNEVTVDLHQAQQLQLRVKLQIEPTESIAVYQELLELTRQPLLSTWADECFAELRAAWTALRATAATEAAKFAIELDHQEQARDLASIAIEAEPYHERAWEIYLKSSAELGSGPEAARRFAGAKREADLAGVGLPAKLSDLARSARDGLIGAASSVLEPGAAALNVFGRTFQRMLEEEPEAAIAFLRSASLATEFNKNPAPTLGLLEKFAKTLEPGSDGHTQVMLLLVRGHYLLNHHDIALSFGSDLLDRPLPDRHRFMLASALAFCHFQMSHWDETFRIIAISIESAEALGSQKEKWGAYSQKASFLWHIGKIEEAYEINQQAFEYFQAQTSTADLMQRDIVAYNTSMMLIHDGREQEALEWAEKAFEGVIKRDFTTTFGFVKPATGYLRAWSGNTKAGNLLTMEGLGNAHRSTNVRGFEIALDMAAASLIVGGHFAEALAVIGLVGEHRDQRACPRTPAETMFVNRLKERCGDAKPSKTWKGLLRRSDLVSAIGQKLLGI